MTLGGTTFTVAKLKEAGYLRTTREVADKMKDKKDDLRERYEETREKVKDEWETAWEKWAKRKQWSPLPSPSNLVIIRDIYSVYLVKNFDSLADIYTVYIILCDGPRDKRQIICVPPASLTIIIITICICSHARRIKMT